MIGITGVSVSHVEHCARFPVDFRGRPVSLIPQLRESLVLISAEEAPRINTFLCSVCGQAWEEEFTMAPRGETVRVRKVSGVERTKIPDPELVSEAIVVWTGTGRSPIPAQDDEAVIQRFGDAALDLLPLVKTLKAEFFASDAANLVPDLTEMGNMAAERFRLRYPQISEEAVDALHWSYTWANK